MQDARMRAEVVPRPTDDELVTLVLDGQQQWFEEIVRRYQGDVQRIAVFTLSDRNTVEDLAQKVFVNVYSHLAEYQPGRDLGAWIRSIARNAVREELRRSARHNRRLQIYSEYVAARMADPKCEQREQELNDSLQECLEQLPDKARRVIHLRYREDKDIAEIASSLGITRGAVRNLLSRIRGKLRVCIERRMSNE